MVGWIRTWFADITARCIFIPLQGSSSHRRPLKCETQLSYDRPEVSPDEAVESTSNSLYILASFEQAQLTVEFFSIQIPPIYHIKSIQLKFPLKTTNSKDDVRIRATRSRKAGREGEAKRGGKAERGGCTNRSTSSIYLIHQWRQSL